MSTFDEGIWERVLAYCEPTPQIVHLALANKYLWNKHATAGTKLRLSELRLNGEKHDEDKTARILRRVDVCRIRTLDIRGVECELTSIMRQLVTPLIQPGVQLQLIEVQEDPWDRGPCEDEDQEDQKLADQESFVCRLVEVCQALIGCLELETVILRLQSPLGMLEKIASHLMATRAIKIYIAGVSDAAIRQSFPPTAWTKSRDQKLERRPLPQVPFDVVGLNQQIAKHRHLMELLQACAANVSTESDAHALQRELDKLAKLALEHVVAQLASTLTTRSGTRGGTFEVEEMEEEVYTEIAKVLRRHDPIQALAALRNAFAGF